MSATVQLPFYVTSEQHEYVIRGDGQCVDVVDRNGQIIWSAQLGRVYAAAVSSDGSWIVLLVSKGTLDAPQHPVLLIFSIAQKTAAGEKQFNEPLMIQQWGQYLGELRFGRDNPIFSLQWMEPHADQPPTSLSVSYHGYQEYLYLNADGMWS